MVTEIGRQPWTIYGILRTKDAVTTAPGLNFSFLGFSSLYIVLAVTLIILLLRVAREPLPKLEWATVTAEGATEGEEMVSK